MDLKKDGTSSGSRSDAPAVAGVAGEAVGARAMPADARELDARYNPAGPAPEGSAPTSQPVGERIPDPLLECLFGDGAAMPFDLAALKTGKDHWRIGDKGRALLADEAANCSKHLGVDVSRETSPWLRLGLAYVAVGLKPMFMEMLERMAKLERKLDERTKTDDNAAAR